MTWPEDQIAHAISPSDTRPAFLKELPYGRVQYGQCQFYYRLFYHCAQELKPACFVELGVLDGWGVLHAKVGYPEMQAFGVDSNDGSYRIDRYAPQFPVTLLVGDSITMAAEFERRFGRIIEMIFFDSDHTPEYLLEEFAIWDRLCLPGAIQMFDDILDRGLRLAWGAIPEPKRMILPLHRETGFGIRIKP